ncbi:MAG: ribosome silencing factor [Gammaproteobacteria bacterium]|nr:ribosome silencing factor [Gammaproteobacteria bacterium]
MKKITLLITDILDAHKAEDILVLDIKKQSDFADFMIIATATSTTQLKTLAHKIATTLAANKIKPIGIEGDKVSEWILVDFGHIIVHIMLPKARAFYALEKLWAKKPKLTKKSRGKSN